MSGSNSSVSRRRSSRLKEKLTNPPEEQGDIDDSNFKNSGVTDSTDRNPAIIADSPINENHQSSDPDSKLSPEDLEKEIKRLEAEDVSFWTAIKDPLFRRDVCREMFRGILLVIVFFFFQWLISEVASTMRPPQPTRDDIVREMQAKLGQHGVHGL